MRRQVKPFVTEYRGGGRRRDASPPGNAAPEAASPRSRSFADAERAFHADAADDSYEAALRAADALFSPASPAGAFGKQPQPTPPIPQMFQMPASDVEAASDEGRAPASLGALAERDVITTPRRILQALEPPAEDRFAALEAERAPKRRGRKPGSKNKPKVIAGDDWPASVALPAAATVAALPATVLPSAPASTPLLADLAPEDSDQSTSDAPQPRGRYDRYGRKRQGLRPGERWKRRLPRAAW